MSSDLKSILEKVIEEDYRNDKQNLEDTLENYKTLILRIAKEKHLDITIWVEGSEAEELKATIKQMNLLERGNIVKGETKYIRNRAFRHYLLTENGKELVSRLLKE